MAALTETQAPRKSNAERLAERTARRRAAGLCLDCREPGQPVVPGRIYCQHHLEKRRKRALEIDNGRKAKGLCVQCGDQAEPGHVRCRLCRILHNHHTVEHTRRRREKGLCPRCGGHKPVKGGLYCRVCAKKYRAYQRKRYQRTALAKRTAAKRVQEWRERYKDNPEDFINRLAMLIRGKPRDPQSAAAD